MEEFETIRIFQNYQNEKRSPEIAGLIFKSSNHQIFKSSTKMSLLEEIISQRIRDEGPLSFRDFMEMCLYYPGLGYYSSGAPRIGPDGDFYTCPNLSPAFGRLIGRQIEQMWRALDEQPLTLVEYGAGKGDLCRAILAFLSENKPLYRQLQYGIIEKNSIGEELVTMFPGKVRRYDSIGEIPCRCACVLSNELLDNFPVHRVEMQDELMEVFVDYRDGFVEILRPADERLKEYLQELKVELPLGYRTEINLQATEWIKEIALHMERGFVITIDYGYTSARLYHPSRNGGTLMCYHRHRIHPSPYENIGQQDITSHVNFSAMAHYGEKYGLACCGLTGQANFLLALAGEEPLPQQHSPGGNVMEMVKREAFIKHTLLVDMGSKYQVLIQQKGLGNVEVLGLRYGRRECANE